MAAERRFYRVSPGGRSAVRPAALARPPELEQLLRGPVAAGELTSALALAGGVEGIEALAWCGRRRLDPERPLGPADAFDLASVSKPWTAALALRLDAGGLLPLDLPLGEAWDRVPPMLARRTTEDLLRHRAGYVPWTPLYRRCRVPARVARRLLDERFLGARRGTYSDLGFVLWALTAERVLGAPLHRLLERHLLAPLGFALRPVGRGNRGPCVECLLGNGREVELAARQGVRIALRGGPPPGTPQDGNARFLGGFAGHSGLFAPAAAVWRLAREWLRPGGLFDRRALAAALAGGGRYALGWARPRAAADRLGPEGLRHLGFTGGAVWIDPVGGRILVLLAHRSAPGIELRTWRRRVLAWFGG